MPREPGRGGLLLLLLCCGACSGEEAGGGGAAEEDEGYYAKLPDLRTSEGTWDKPFDPDRSSYEVRLPASASAVTVEAVVDFARYAGPEEYPLLSIDGKQRHYGSSDLIADTINIDNSSLGNWEHNVAVVVKQPPGAVASGPAAETTYRLKLLRGADVEQLLTPRTLALEDDQGRTVVLTPAFNASDVARAYQATLEPAVRKVRVSFECEGLAETEVEGKMVSSGQPTWVSVAQRQASTVVRAACVYGNDRRTLQVSLFERADLEALAASLEIMVLGSEGHIERTGNTSFVVHATVPAVELVPIYRDARIALRLAAPNATDVALGPGMPTPALAVPPSGSRTVQLLLLSHSDSLNITVELTRSHSHGHGGSQSLQKQPWGASTLGFALAASVGGCVVFGALVAGVSTALGRGGPLESSAALRSLALLLQFTAMANVVAGPGSMQDFARALRWLCLLPGTVPWEASEEASVPASLGAEHAALCLGACLLLLGAVATVHLLVLAVRLLRGCRRTVPHGLRLGTWEVRCLQHVAYPASCAGALLLLIAPPDGQDAQSADAWWRAAAVAALTAPAVVGLAAACSVRRALRLRLVAWVSEETGLLCDAARGLHDELRRGRLGNPEAGCYRDAECDQVCTLPEERSCCPGLSLRWAGTAAAIRPLGLAPLLRAAEGREEAACALLEDEDGSGSEDETGGSNHLLLPDQGRCRAVVEVLETNPCCAYRCCGRRALAEVGTYAGVDWLEAVLGPDELIRLHQQAQSPAARRQEPSTPVRVEVSQLQGPITCGRLGFCFNGMRWPHFPPLELAFRGTLGALSGAALALPSCRSAALAGASCLAGGLFAVTFAQAPCTSFGENAALLLAQLGLAFAAFAFLGYAGGAFSPEVCGGVVLLCDACALAPALVCALLRTLTLCCAALGASRSTEQDSESRHGCNADLGLRWPRDLELLAVPARCQVPVVQCTVHAQQTSETSADVYVHKKSAEGSRPRLEFPVLDYIAPVDRLEPPRALLLGPAQTLAGWSPLGSRAEAIYPDEDPKPIVEVFVERSVGIDFAHDVVAEVLSALAQHSETGRILVLELVAPLPSEAASTRAAAGGLPCCVAGGQSSDGSSEGESETLLAASG